MVLNDRYDNECFNELNSILISKGVIKSLPFQLMIKLELTDKFKISLLATTMTKIIYFSR